MSDVQWHKIRFEFDVKDRQGIEALLVSGHLGAYEIEDSETFPAEGFPRLTHQRNRFVIYLELEPGDQVPATVSTVLAEIDSKFQVESYAPIKVDPDWMTRWKEFIKPTWVGDVLLIKPRWDETDPKGAKVIYIDPGLAFGTGNHETTRLCLNMVRAFMDPSQEKTKQVPIQMLDVGTGSGVLAIAAIKLGLPEVLGIDVDPVSIEVAEANCLDNNVIPGEQVHLATTPIAEIEKQFPIVIANIISPVLVKLSEDLVRTTARDGVLILSGILVEDLAETLTVFKMLGMEEVSRTQENEWGALRLRHYRE